jgi:hypothetical protein
LLNISSKKSSNTLGTIPRFVDPRGAHASRVSDSAFSAASAQAGQSLNYVASLEPLTEGVGRGGGGGGGGGGVDFLFLAVSPRRRQRLPGFVNPRQTLA